MPKKDRKSTRLTPGFTGPYKGEPRPMLGDTQFNDPTGDDDLHVGETVWDAQKLGVKSSLHTLGDEPTHSDLYGKTMLRRKWDEEQRPKGGFPEAVPPRWRVK